MTQFEKDQFKRFVKAICDPVPPAEGRYEYGREAAVDMFKECGMVNNNRATAERLWKRITTTCDYGWHVQRMMQTSLDEFQQRTGLTGARLAQAARTCINGAGIFQQFLDSMRTLSGNTRRPM
jgi:hypothetical protein